MAKRQGSGMPLALLTNQRGDRVMAGEKIYRNRIYYKRDPLERLMERVVVDPTTVCWNWTGKLMHHGYGRMELGGKQMYAHRASWAIHQREVPEGKILCHHCDNRRCVNPEHMYVGTAQDNSNDAVERDRLERGAHRYNSKLTAENVAEIRTLFSVKSDIEIARQFGVHDATIYNIRKGKRWKRS